MSQNCGKTIFIKFYCGIKMDFHCHSIVINFKRIIFKLYFRIAYINIIYFNNNIFIDEMIMQN